MAEGSSPRLRSPWQPSFEVLGSGLLVLLLGYENEGYMVLGHHFQFPRLESSYVLWSDSFITFGIAQHRL